MLVVIGFHQSNATFGGGGGGGGWSGGGKDFTSYFVNLKDLCFKECSDQKRSEV